MSPSLIVFAYAATMASKSFFSESSLFSSQLTIEQLIDVLYLLKKCGFPQTRWHELGLTLGLHKNTLDAIERNHSGDVYRCLLECLSQWLSRADNVDSKGGATFDSLSDALKSMNENAAADKLDQEKRNAMISGNDIKGTNDVHSTATGPAPPPGTNKPLIGGPPLSPIALMDIPDDRPTVPELIKFYELLTKRVMGYAVNDPEGIIRAFEEHPILLHILNLATESKFSLPEQLQILQASIPQHKLPPRVDQKPLLVTNASADIEPQVMSLPSQFCSSQSPQPPPVPPRRQSLPAAIKAPPQVSKSKKTSAYAPLPPSMLPSCLANTLQLQPTAQQSQDLSSAPLEPTATLLQQQEQKKDSSSLKPPKGSMSPEYITMKEMLTDLIDLLAGNAPVISQINSHLLTDVTVETTGDLTPYERANKIFSSVLVTLECHPNPNSVFSSLITSLQKVGLKNMASKLMENLKMKGGHVDLKLEQQPSVSEGPLQPVDVTALSHTPQPTITGSQSSTPTTVIELSSKSEVATNIGNLHSRFANLDSNIRDEFEELVEKGKVKLKAVARRAATYLRIEVSSLKYGDVDELFDSLQPHYDFFSCGVLNHLTDTYLLNAQTELTQYINSVDEFAASSQLKHIRSTIKEKLSSLPAAASPTTSDQKKPVVIKLNDRWEELTLTRFKRVLQYYFGDEIADISTIVEIGNGSVVITLLIPTSLSQSLIDTINNKTNSMSRLGILEVAVDNVTVLKRRNNKDFDTSLHESVKAGDSFEVSMLLQLGADPNSKEIANGGEETEEVKWENDSVTLTNPSISQCQEMICKLKGCGNYQYAHLYDSSPDIVLILMSQVLDIRTIKYIHIVNTKITKDVILLLSHKIANNNSLKALSINYDSINDDGVIALSESLISNRTIITLYLNNNPDITSTSAQSLAELLLYNHTLSGLYLDSTNIDTDGMLLIVESLRTNNTLLRELYLDSKHKQACYSLSYYKTIKNRLFFL